MQIFATKRAVTKLAEGEAGLDPKIAARIRCVHDDPRLKAAGAVLQRLKEQLRDAESRLVDARNRPSDFSRPAASAESDAAALLSGGSLDDLRRHDRSA